MVGPIRLYIIGNGFDLFHKLPTSYSHFKAFVKPELPDLFDILDTYFDEYLLWQDFENGLGTYNSTDFFYAHNNTDILSEEFRPSDCYGLEDEIIEQTDHLVNDIKEAFPQWIETVNENLHEKQACLKFKDNATYLNFNYTETLTTVYNVPANNILYIHGNVAQSEDLIVGHNSTRDEKDELDENGDSNRTMLIDSQSAAEYPFFAFQKPVDEIIKQNKNFFEALSNVDEVFILGHSLSEIDLPYFIKIKESICNNAKWFISFHKEENKVELLKSMKSIGCSTPNFIQINDLSQSIL